MGDIKEIIRVFKDEFCLNIIQFTQAITYIEDSGLTIARIYIDVFEFEFFLILKEGDKNLYINWGAGLDKEFGTDLFFFYVHYFFPNFNRVHLIFTGKSYDVDPSTAIIKFFKEKIISE